MRKRTLCGWCLCWILITTSIAHPFIIDPDFTPWQTTASGRRFGRGVPGELTWSFALDGTAIDDGQSELGGSDLIAYLNESFDGDPNQPDHTQQPWFPIFEQSFQRWDELSGLTFTYEANDDGGDHSSRRGILGTRGDIRIGGVPIDGPNGTLAFNFLSLIHI